MMATRLALITGGMGGLGETISTKMAGAGYRVVVTYSPSNTKYRAWLEEMKGRGHSFSAYPVDVVNYDDCARKCAQIQGECGPIDILVNNAGITRDMTFRKMTKAAWDEVMRTNLDSCFNMTKQVMDGMVERAWPRHQRVVGQRAERRLRADQLLGGQGRHPLLHQGARARGGAQERDGEYHFAGLHRHADGHRHSEGNSRLEDPAADPARAARQARGGCRPDYLSVLRGSGIRHRREHFHQRRPAHVLRSRLRHMSASPQESREARMQSQVRLIKKYPNRRLYDTKTSSYITLADVKQMVLKQEDFQVIDAKSGDDLTRAILLQIILEEESGGVPMFSSDLLSQLIRSYGNAMQGMMGSYLERNIRAFQDIQKALQEQSHRMYGDNSRASQELWAQFMNLQGPAMQSLMQAYMEQSQKMFSQFQEQMQSQARNMFSGLSFPGFPAGQPTKNDPEKQ